MAPSTIMVHTWSPKSGWIEPFKAHKASTMELLEAVLVREA